MTHDAASLAQIVGFLVAIMVLARACADEGLFEAARKRRLPAMPAVVGVITSPTGAVIRDILHRLRERLPCHVVVWPVVVQGDAAAAQDILTQHIQGCVDFAIQNRLLG